MTARLTEAERRRAAGEAPFYDGSPYAKLALAFLQDSTRAGFDSHHPAIPALPCFACTMLAAQLRALVLQTLLVTFSPPWGEP